MSGPGATPLFVDTGPLYARFDDDDQHHGDTVAVFRDIASGDLVYRPLYVSAHTLSEFATLMLRRAGPEATAAAVQRVRDSDLFTVVHPTESAFADACEALAEYDDRSISLVDHLTAVLANERECERVFAFDSDFRALGLALVPADTR